MVWEFVGIILAEVGQCAMSRIVITAEADARAELRVDRAKPTWREGRHSLPFHELSDDEFEIFCFLLLKREHPNDDIRYFGKTGDAGRDILHRRVTPTGLTVRLIQCKRYGSNVGAPVIRKDMAKVWVNVFDGTIPELPAELVFYVVPDLTNPAKDLIDSQDLWRQQASAAIQEHIKRPVPDDLTRHAANWWPNPTSEAALSLTERANKYSDLIEEFFGMRKVIEGSVPDVTNAVCERLLPPLARLDERIARVEEAVVAQPQTPHAAVGNFKALFSSASNGLLRWPTTVAGDRWLDRPELQGLLDQVSSNASSVSVVLGPPGCGKSALLARLGQQLVGQGMAVLAIKADQLRNAVDSASKLAERLGLSVLTDVAVLAVAETEPVVFLVDQLDALADLVDLKSERLHVLLNLIDKLGGRAGVHVVCSCREFEFRHDGRLSRLDAHAVRLQPPAWEQVSSVLTAHEVSADAWPEDAKSLLRVPYHLDVFLNRLRGPGEHPIFTTYQQLFNDLWQEQVGRPGGGRSELLHDLAAQLAEREELWIDRSRFEDRWALVETLIAADILRLTEDEFRIGFRHQSLFEFTLAKTFAREGNSLSAYVLGRQDALFVRPTLWMALNYLRRASPAVYAREFDVLWNQASIRRHVKHLLIDFLSQVEEPPPADWEQSRMITALRDDSWRRKVLAAVNGKPLWFQLFAGSQLPAEMRKSPQEASDVIRILVSAQVASGERCLQLMEDNWLPDDSKLPLIWRTLIYLNNWNERAVDLAIAVIRRTAIDQGGMWHLAQTIANSNPALAVRLVAAWLAAARQRILAADSSQGEDRTDELRSLLDRHNSWHDIGKLAGDVPEDFVQALWPELREITRHVRSRPSDFVIRYADDGVWFARLDRREYVAFDSPDQFFQALDGAMRAFARIKPLEFLALVRGSGNPDSRLLQRLICRGVREIAPSHPAAALEFLMADARRLWLGGMHDDLGDSVELVGALAPHLTDDQLRNITAAICTWEMFREREGVERDPGDIYARGYRLRLLLALPFDRLSPEVRSEIEAERAALPEHVQTTRSRTGTGPRAIGSPVSQAQMISLTDTQIADLFDELPDSTGWHNPNDWMVGGSVQLSQEFQEFAKVESDRALTVVARLRPREQERPAAHAVRGLVAAKRPPAEIIGLVRELDARGFVGQEFRETVAFALDDLARADGLTEEACDLLNRWRLADWPNNDRDDRDNENRGEAGKPTSVLWQHNGIVTHPQGRFPVLSALTSGYLCRKPHAADLWLEMLRDHVNREESVRNWRAMCVYLDDIRCCSNRVHVRGFLDQLFNRYPAVLTCQVGARLLARVAQLLPDEVRKRGYDTVRTWGTERGSQAFGELVCLRHLLHPEDDWASVRVEAALVQSTIPGDEWTAVGVAFAAANLWQEPSCRARATELLRQLARWPNERVGQATMSIFKAHDELPADEPTLSLLRQVESDPEILVRSDIDELFFDHLLDMFPVDTELVCRISEEAVLRRGAELQSVQHRLYMASSALIDISLRLQRSGGDYRRRGMQLFEALLDLGVDEAISVAMSNDLRLVPALNPLRLPRRRRMAAR